MYSTEWGTQPQEEGAWEGRGREDEGGGTKTKTVIWPTKVTAGCKAPEDKLKGLLWGA